MPEKDKPNLDPRRYVAVVHFHGIGQQRHYQEVSLIVEQLDRLARARYKAKDPDFPAPQLDEVRGRHEPFRGTTGDVERSTVYVQAGYGRTGERVRVRFYEAYWAPATADVKPLAVFAWLLRQLMRPFTLALAPWRAFERLRRADLFALCRKTGVDHKELNEMLGLYRRFYGFEARRDFPKGRFDDFVEFASEGGRDSRLVSLCRLWKLRHFSSQLYPLTWVLLLALALAGAVSLLGVVCWRLLELTQTAPGIAQFLRDAAKPSADTLLALAGAVLTLTGVTRALANYAGEFQQFTTYEEVQEHYEQRRAMLDAALAQLRHVLADPLCERVVVSARSLGTAVAFDALIELGRLNLAHSPADAFQGPVQIHKLQHLVTCGSPIDKIEYFFGSTGSRTRVYDRLTDDLRGDLHDPPFSKSGRQPQLRWINYWDRGDVISGLIDTVIPSDYRKAEVKNIRIASHRLPDLAGSHAGYFSHAGFMSELFRVIFDNRYSYVDPPREPDGRPIEPVYRADSPWMLQALFFLPIATVPALLALTAAGLLLHWRSPAPLLLTVVVASLVVFRLLHRAGFDQEEPIR